MPPPCPQCGSTERGLVSQRRKDKRGIFQVDELQKCAACGHVWEPPSPTWFLLLGLCLGLLLSLAGIAIAIYLVAIAYHNSRFWFGICSLLIVAGPFIMGGIFAIRGCIRRLREKSSAAQNTGDAAAPQKETVPGPRFQERVAERESATFKKMALWTFIGVGTAAALLVLKFYPGPYVVFGVLAWVIILSGLARSFLFGERK